MLAQFETHTRDWMNTQTEQMEA